MKSSQRTKHLLLKREHAVWRVVSDRHGGTHHGYFLPSEGASDKALALFGFPSLAAYEEYRTLFGRDPDFIEADRLTRTFPGG